MRGHGKADDDPMNDTDGSTVGFAEIHKDHVVDIESNELAPVDDVDKAKAPERTTTRVWAEPVGRNAR